MTNKTLYLHTGGFILMKYYINPDGEYYFLGKKGKLDEEQIDKINEIASKAEELPKDAKIMMGCCREKGSIHEYYVYDDKIFVSDELDKFFNHIKI